MLNAFYVRPRWGFFEEIMVFFTMCGVVAASLLFKAKCNVAYWIPAVFLLLITVQAYFDQRIFVRMVFVNVFIALLVVKVVADRITFTSKSLGKYLTIILSFNSVILILQKCGLPLISTNVYPAIAGTFMLSWVLGSFAAISVPFIMKYNKWGLLAVIMPLYCATSTVCFAVAALAVVFCICKNWKDTLFVLFIVFVMILGYVKFIDGAIDENRWHVWKQVHTYNDHQLLGSSLGSFAHKGFLNKNAAMPYFKWLLNEPYQLWFECGVWGLAILVVYLAWLSVCFDRTLLIALYATILISMFHPILHSGKIVPLVIIIVAMCERNINAKFNLRSLE